MTTNQKIWSLSRNQLAKAVASLGYPEEFADLLAKQLGSPKAIDRLASYIRQAHPDSVEMIVDEMVSIQEEIAAWREKKVFREASEGYNTWLNSEERLNREEENTGELTAERTGGMRDLYIRSMSLPEPLSRDSYLNGLPVVKHLAEHGIEFHKQVTFFVGENGSGKSTLIEALAVSQGFNPESGTKNFNFSTKDSHSELWDYLRVARGVIYPRDGYFLRAESYYNFATNIEQLDEDEEDFEYAYLLSHNQKIIESYGGKSLHRQSHGESFLALVENRFGGHGLYILDEPEAALSPRGIIRLMRNMDRLIKEDSQFIISTHSPMLLAFPDAEVYEIRDKGIVSVPYYQTDHYRTTVRFLQNPESAIEDILGTGESND
jgi:predicted ATPase